MLSSSHESEVHAKAGDQRAWLFTWGCDDTACHETQTHVAISTHAADLLGLAYAGRGEDRALENPGFVIPRTTVCGDDGARIFGSSGPDPSRFLGGFVPVHVAATKAIAHPLAEGETPPPGWSRTFAEKVRPLVLNGSTAFSPEPALKAGQRMLAEGPVRIKAVRASGGSGQFVVTTARDLEMVLSNLDRDGTLAAGVVLEENLTGVATYSVGQIDLGRHCASYFGTQTLTRNNCGEDVYGGSRLMVTRGGFDTLLRLLPPRVAGLCDLAIRFDRLCAQELGLIASRRNYDVIVGIDTRRRQRRAVLEQSWRVGGATPAELMALTAFEQNPDLAHVVAASVERFGDDAVLPTTARLYYRGNDAVVGPLLKYGMLQDRF